jgi:hypothetical protein
MYSADYNELANNAGFVKDGGVCYGTLELTSWKNREANIDGFRFAVRHGFGSTTYFYDSVSAGSTVIARDEKFARVEW